MSDIVQTQPEGPFEATPKAELERQIMDPNIPKMEREWWAADEITRLRAEVEKLRAALEPFADESLWCGLQHEFVTVNRSDCDRARAASTQETRDE